MIDRIAKGRRLERMCYDELAAYPYRWKTIRHKWLNIDFWQLFDVVVGSPTEIRFIQVKTGYCPTEVKDRIREMKLPSFCRKEVWCWFPKKGFIKEIIE